MSEPTKDSGDLWLCVGIGEKSLRLPIVFFAGENRLLFWLLKLLRTVLLGDDASELFPAEPT